MDFFSSKKKESSEAIDSIPILNRTQSLFRTEFFGVMETWRHRLELYYVEPVYKKSWKTNAATLLGL